MQPNNIWYVRPEHRPLLYRLWIVSTVMFLIPLARAGIAYLNGADAAYICRCLGLWSITSGIIGLVISRRWSEDRSRIIAGILTSVVANVGMVAAVFGAMNGSNEFVYQAVLPCGAAGIGLGVILAFEAGHWFWMDETQAWGLAWAAAPFGFGTIIGGILLLLHRGRHTPLAA